MNRQPKKRNLFAFFKSEGFNQAREKLCAIYILLSYVNELHEDVERLLKGYDGMYIGELKHTSKEATRAFETYEKTYRSFIATADDLCDATIDVTSAIDVQLEQSKFFLQEAYKAICKKVDEQVALHVHDPKALEEESFCGFEIFDRKTADYALSRAKMQCRAQLHKAGLEDKADDVIRGLEMGFNAAVNLTNQIYLNQK